jgi:hypothetical protein
LQLGFRQREHLLLLLGRLLGNGRCSAHRDFALLGRCNQLVYALVEHRGGTLHSAATDAQQLGCICLRYCAIWRKVSPLALPHRRETGRNHGALARVEVPSVQVEPNHVGDGLGGIAMPDYEPRRYAGHDTRHYAVSPVETNALAIEHDRLAQPIDLESAARSCSSASDIIGNHVAQGAM